MKTQTTQTTQTTRTTQKVNSDDLIKKYLLQGGNVTQCKPYNPGGQSGAIRVKGARKRDLGSKNGRINSKIRYEVN